MTNEMRNVPESEIDQYHQINDQPPIPKVRETVHGGRCFKCSKNDHRITGIFITILGGAQIWFNYCLYTNDPAVAFLNLKNTTNPFNETAVAFGLTVGASWIVGGLCLTAGCCSKMRHCCKVTRE